LKENVVQHLKTFVVAVGIALWLPVAALSAEETTQPPEKPVQSGKAAAPAPKCLKAAVNPVTGFAICLEPKGAPVDPPERSALRRPCKPRAHDADPFTVYEHWSGCH
jgi:hypothetical protein